MIKHKCIKPDCTNVYEDNDPDAYYCPSCNEARKIVAKTVDRKMANVSRQRFSNLQVFDESSRSITTTDGRKVSFIMTKL